MSTTAAFNYSGQKLTKGSANQGFPFEKKVVRRKTADKMSSRYACFIFLGGSVQPMLHSAD
jgi:hypothetical protein